MKRKFLAKAITLGLMLAVPLSAYAKDVDGNAEGIIVNNEDKQTVVNGSDLSIDINKPITTFTQINGVNGNVVGFGIADGSNIDLKSLKITNSVTNDFTQYVRDTGNNTEMEGVMLVNGTLNTKSIDINLTGNNSYDEKIGTKDPYVGVFGIRTIGKSDKIKPVINIDGDVNINVKASAYDIANPTSTARGILFQDNDGTELNIKGTTNITAIYEGENAGGLFGLDFGGSSNDMTGHINSINLNDVNITLNGGINQYGIKCQDGDKFSANNIKIKMNSEEVNEIYGFRYAGLDVAKYNTIKDNDASFVINGTTNIEINSKSNNEDGNIYGIGFETKNRDVSLTNDVNVTINANNGNVDGLYVAIPANNVTNPHNLNLENFNAQIAGGKVIKGIDVTGKAQLKVNNINLAIYGNENTETINGIALNQYESSILNADIRVNNTGNAAKENIVGISLNSNNTTTITGNVNLDVENGYAINAADGLQKDFELGKDSTKTVIVKGDVKTKEASSGAIVINLKNAQSSFEGAATGKVDLNLQKGSTWTNTGASTVNKLTLNGANLVQANNSATITKANSGTFKIAGDNTIALNTKSNGSVMTAGEAADGANLFTDGAFANNVADDTTIKLTSANQNATDISKDKAGESFDNLLKALGDSNLKSKVTSAHLDGSYTTNAIDAEVGSDGKFASSTITQSDADTETIAAIKKLPSINLISWRTENNELSKRLGEVRDYDGEEGIWARMNHGESKYLDSFKTKAHLYQMGYDKKVGEWRLGGAVSYNKGTTTYENGNGKNRSTSLALYGAWLGDKGHYADIIVKEGKQKSELTIGQAGLAASNLDYDLWATSISAEYGRKIALKSDWFVEPQAELTYGRLDSADYGDNGFSVHQDSMDSLVGRMGFRLGKNLSDTSNIYMKASVLHEFCGDVDYSFTEGTTSKVSSADLGDTWYEVGVGGSAQIGKATYAYAGIEKTFGGDFSTPWQWNAGVRWSF